MRRLTRNRRVGVVATLLLVGWLPVARISAYQEAPAPGADRAAQLAAARARIDALEADITRLAARRENVVNEFEAADVELALRRQQLSVLREQRDLLVGEGADQEAQLAVQENVLQRRRTALAERVRALYRIGPISYHRVLLAAGDSPDAVIAYQLAAYLTGQDRDLIRAVRDGLSAVEATHARRRQNLQELARVEQEATSAASALAAQQEERRRQLGLLDMEAEARRVALEDAERSAGALETTIAGFAETPAADATAFVDARGALPWPVDGDIVGSFGRRPHAVYDTFTVSRGIEIEALEGTPVLAVAPGRVVFADWYSGYGLLVILDHGGGYFTLYGHLSEIGVRARSAVRAGERVGAVGETASLTGPNLYFELREGTDALNPTGWLAPR